VDFKVIAASDLAERTEKSDASLTAGRFATAGSEEPTSSKASVSLVAHETTLLQALGAEEQRVGVFLRYVSSEKWLMAVLEQRKESGFGVFPPIPAGIYLRVIKNVSGSVTVLDEARTGFSGGLSNTVEATVALSASSAGTWTAWTYTGSTAGGPLLEGQDSALATGGTLAKGKGGFYDAYTGSASTRTRKFDNFNLLAAEPASVMLYSGKTAEIRSEGYFRQDESGSYYGEFPQRGGDLYLDPEGDSGRINRLVIKARRNDVEVEEDSAVTDKMRVEVIAQERFLSP
jgi:hypothetical protein